MTRIDDRQILVVGAGIGGLCLTRSLRRAGFSPVIVDRTPRWDDDGTGIAIWNRGSSLLADCEDVDDVLGVGSPLTTWEMHGPDSERRSEPVEDREGNNPLIALHDVQLRRLFRPALPREHVRLGTEIDHVTHQDDAVEITFDDGVREQFDLVVGADGANSRVRPESADGSESAAKSACWSFWLDYRVVRPGTAVDVLGPSGTAIEFIPYDDRTFARVLQTGVRAGHLPTLSDCRRIVEAIESPYPDVDDLLTDESLAGVTSIPSRPSTWTDGRIALIGEAATPSSPLSWSRHARAIEDALTLADELAAGSGSIDAALERYEARRRARRRSLLDDTTFRERLPAYSSLSRPIRTALVVRWNALAGERGPSGSPSVD